MLFAEAHMHASMHNAVDVSVSLCIEQQGRLAALKCSLSNAPAIPENFCSCSASERSCNQEDDRCTTTHIEPFEAEVEYVYRLRRCDDVRDCKKVVAEYHCHMQMGLSAKYAHRNTRPRDP